MSKPASCSPSDELRLFFCFDDAPFASTSAGENKNILLIVHRNKTTRDEVNLVPQADERELSEKIVKDREAKIMKEMEVKMIPSKVIMQRMILIEFLM